MKLLIPDLPTIDEAMPYLRRVGHDGVYTNDGPLVRLLEKRLREEHFHGAHVIAVANATLGLELVLAGREGNAVSMPAFTFKATYTAAKRASKFVSFVDINPETWCAETGQSHFINVRVCAFGACPDGGIAGEVIDAAAAFGNFYPAPGQTAVFSMHATKPFGCGEGGFIVTYDDDEACRLRMTRAFGIGDGEWLPGSTNAKLSEWHAAIALAQLDRWEDVSDLRRVIALQYTGMLKDAGLEVQRRSGIESFGTMVCLVPYGVDVEVVRGFMAENDIETRRWYWPALHKQFGGKPLPITEDISNRLIGLPFHTKLRSPDLWRIVSSLRSAIERASA